SGTVLGGVLVGSQAVGDLFIYAKRLFVAAGGHDERGGAPAGGGWGAGQPGQVGRADRSRIRPFPPCIIAKSRMLVSRFAYVLGTCSYAPNICSESTTQHTAPPLKLMS